MWGGYATVLRSELALRAGLHVFNARTQGLVPSSNSDAREILLRSLSPEYADGTLTRSM